MIEYSLTNHYSFKHKSMDFKKSRQKLQFCMLALKQAIEGKSNILPYVGYQLQKINYDVLMVSEVGLKCGMQQVRLLLLLQNFAII